MTLAIPSPDEVKEAISQMSPSSSPGIDGFTGYFYSACWDIIHADMYRFIVDFFKGAYIPKEVSATTLILIPKIPCARTLGDFRPISLRNFSGKIISKYWRLAWLIFCLKSWTTHKLGLFRFA